MQHHFCMDCNRRRDVRPSGSCAVCDSSAVMEMNPDAELGAMTAKDAYLKLIAALDSRMPDTELLQGDGDPVEDLVKKRMRILNATAQAMIEETSAAELARHKPIIPRLPSGEIPSYDQITHCACGMRYQGKMPEAHQKHVDRVLVSLISTIRTAVLRNRQINWMDVKGEADQWGNATLKPMPN